MFTDIKKNNLKLKNREKNREVFFSEKNNKNLQYEDTMNEGNVENFNEKYKNLLPINPTPQILAMKGYKEDSTCEIDGLRLDSNENPYGPSQIVLDVIKQIKLKDLAFYPKYSNLQKLLAEKNDVLPSQIILTNGGDEGIRLICATFLTCESKVLVLNPTFSMYEIYAKSISSQVKNIDYYDNFAFPLKSILESIDSNTKLIFLGNPNNPTGDSLSKKDLIQICNCATSSLIIIDEAYVQFDTQTLLPLMKKWNNIILIRSFSKYYGLAGLRLGYLIATPSIIQFLNRIKSPYNVNQIAVLAGIAALQSQSYFINNIEEIRQTRELFRQKLLKNGFEVYPSAANFLLINFQDKCEYIYNRLISDRIFIRRFSDSTKLKTCLRVTIGTPIQMDLVLQYILRYLVEYNLENEIQRKKRNIQQIQQPMNAQWRH